MIKMNQPSLVFNSDDVPGPKYIMWQSKDAPRGVSAQWTVNQIAMSNADALLHKKTSLANVVINCHGDYDALAIGGLGTGGGKINSTNVGAFATLKPLNIGTIWLVACKMARYDASKTLCKLLATMSGSQVVAADEDQETGVWGTYRLLCGLHGQIDEFEGNVYSFTPDGGMRIIDPHGDIYTIKE
jgi:hypothetical protein